MRRLAVLPSSSTTKAVLRIARRDPAARKGACSSRFRAHVRLTLGRPALSMLKYHSWMMAFTVDDTVPGPTLAGGYYRFVRFQHTQSIGPTRLSYPASLVATVTNTSSHNHTIVVS